MDARRRDRARLTPVAADEPPNLFRNRVDPILVEADENVVGSDRGTRLIHKERPIELVIVEVQDP